MAEPIKATCRSCKRAILLSEVALGTGICPTCGVVLAPGYTHLLLEEARRAEMLQRNLAACLRRLTALPGNLLIDRDAVYEAISAPPSAAEQRTVDATIAAEAGRALRQAVEHSWPGLPRAGMPGRSAGLVSQLRGLAQRMSLMALMNRGGQSTEQEAAAAVLADAAKAVDEAADAMEAGRQDAKVETRKALDKAVATTEQLSDEIA